MQRSIYNGRLYKLRTYALFKYGIYRETYLVEVLDVRKRRLLSCLRMGVLPLRIETGRYEACQVKGAKGVPLEFRVCECCCLDKVEDEIHFVMECPFYVNEREVFFEVCESELGKVFSSLILAGDVVKCFECVMRSDDQLILLALANFVWVSFKKRARRLGELHKCK